MLDLSAKLASAFFVTAAIGLGGLAVGLPDYVATAADGCLTEPSGANPQGQHWYYRIERGTGRKCWYLRGQGEQSARADTPDALPSAKPAPRKQDLATTRSIADAHAELSPRTRVADDVAPSVWPNSVAAAPAAPAAPADNSAAPSQQSSRWSQAAPADSTAAPADQAPEASLMVADAQSDSDANTPQQPSVVPPPPGFAPAERKTGSIQMLLLVAGGALALAGLTGSAVYRLGRRRKRNDWLRERTEWQSERNPRNPPWVEPADLDEAHEMVPPSDLRQSLAEAEYSDERVERIEDFLARLSAKLHHEMETRGERDAHASS
jgi:hypothetical protein